MTVIEFGTALRRAGVKQWHEKGGNVWAFRHKNYRYEVSLCSDAWRQQLVGCTRWTRQGHNIESLFEEIEGKVTT